MKQDKATTQVHEICRHCGDPYTVKERIRIYGDNPFMAGYCSAGCYTEGILMKADPSPSIPVKIKVGDKMKFNKDSDTVTCIEVSKDGKSVKSSGGQWYDMEGTILVSSIPVNDEFDNEIKLGSFVEDMSGIVGKVTGLGNAAGTVRVMFTKDCYRDLYPAKLKKVQYSPDQLAKMKQDSFALTYGKGYNPAAMEELYKELADVIPVLQYKGDCETVIERIKTALHNAKTIKP